MAIGDYVNPTWVNKSSKLDATAMQTITNKIEEIDNELTSSKYTNRTYVYIRDYDSSMDSSNTPVADSYFDTQLELKEAVYEVEMVAFVTGDSTGNFRSSWELTGGCSALTLRSCFGASNGAYDANDTQMQTFGVAVTSNVSYGTDGTNTTTIRERFIISTTSAESYIKWKWSQDTSTAGSTTVKTGSYMRITEVSHENPV